MNGGARAVDVGRQGLAARQQVVGVLHVGVTQLPQLVRARHDLHAARLDRRIGQRHPGGDVADRIEREIGRVLVPAHIGAGAGILRPDREMEQPDVRADQVLDRVEDLGRMHDLVDPREQEMRLEVVAARHLLALGALEGLQPARARPRARSAEKASTGQT